MVARQTTVLLMAAGTGGHVFPALAIARRLSQLGARVEWLGTPLGMENELLAGTGFTVHQISVNGLKGSGFKRKMTAPYMLIKALWQSIGIIRSVRPDCVLGMGGFVSGPGGLAAKLLGKPLFIHEQNAVAGATNRILARWANRVFEAFPQTFPASDRVVYTGNPLRDEIVQLHNRQRITQPGALRVLVLGGSRGATAINAVIPAMLALWPQSSRPQVLHQTGRQALAATRALYASAGLPLNDACRVEPFIADMAAAYTWADVVVCRSGASTVSELAAAGLPAVLVPYPHHADQQQLHNANWLVDAGAGVLLVQKQMTAAQLLQVLQDLDSDRTRLTAMARAASSLAICDASDVIARSCLEAALA